MQASRQSKNRGIKRQENNREEQFQKISSLLSGPLRIRAHTPEISTDVCDLVSQPSAEAIIDVSDKRSDVEEFTKNKPFLTLVVLSMLEKNGYTEKSFTSACREHYNIYDKQRIALESLEKLFQEIHRTGSFEHVAEYIKFQRQFNSDLVNTSISDDEFEAAYSMYEEARLVLVSEGVKTENEDLQQKIQYDVDYISEKLIQFFFEQDCVSNWSVRDIIGLFVAVEGNLGEVFHKIAPVNPKDGLPDTNSFKEFAYASASIVCNIFYAITAKRSEAERKELIDKLSSYKDKIIQRYKGASFDKNGFIYSQTEQVKGICEILSVYFETVNTKNALVSRIDHFKNISWIQNSPFLSLDRANLSMPKGEFMLCIEEGDSPAFVILFRGRTGETELFLEDEECGLVSSAYTFSVTRQKYRLFAFMPSQTCMISSTDSVSAEPFDKYVSEDKQEWFKEFSHLCLDLKYMGLQLLANIERRFPRIFDQAYNLDAIQIYVNGETSKLHIVSTRGFLDRNMDVFRVVKDKVYSKDNELFEGIFGESHDVEAVYSTVNIKFSRDPDREKLIERVSDENEICFEFPLSYFIEGAHLVEKEEEELPEIPEEKIDYWAKIDDIFRKKNKNIITFDEFLKLLEPFGDVTINKAGGKGSHFKLYLNEDSDHFATVSKKRREDGLFLIELKSVLVDLDISLESFYNMLISRK